MEPIEPNPRQEERRDDPETGLEGPMWRMELGGGEPAPYPERQGRPDCAYYMRTGRCGFGDGCRYNHPHQRGTVAEAAIVGSPEHTEPIIRPACKYFVKHGTCKFGDLCKFKHPKQDGYFPLSSLNKCGYPLRPGEKDCSYYVRTGCCKFGLTCKFNHPELSLAPNSLPASPAYSMVQPPMAPSPQQYPLVTNWEFAPQSMLPASYMQGPYGPVFLFPGIMPDPSLNVFLGTVNPIASSSGQHTAQGESHYGLSTQISSLHPTHTEYYPMMASSVSHSNKSETEHLLPERLDEPECQECKRTSYSELGSRCKYHQPPEYAPPEASCVFNPIGHPRR
ncbi:zinc finger CCCH domain-containing protein 32-like isoform X3 [Canna indica]|uniref:Zinc finger CCCH domain-containing protein 32-like isoform X3 n=1 Tax=Canna indica TaxID=4628 RepID=A0AAQ3JTL0_9LILI|nr:zinc finger CCCH domain-containing protein 32-like isoform X3 [Canna indica]